MAISLLKCMSVNDCSIPGCILKRNKLYTIDELDFYARTKKDDYYCKKFQCTPQVTIVQKLERSGEVLIESTGHSGNVEVKLLPGRYMSSESNPAIGSPYECTGALLIEDTGSSYHYIVEWYTGTNNTYREGDLVIVNGNNQCVSIWSKEGETRC